MEQEQGGFSGKSNTTTGQPKWPLFSRGQQRGRISDVAPIGENKLLQSINRNNSKLDPGEDGGMCQEHQGVKIIIISSSTYRFQDSNTGPPRHSRSGRVKSEEGKKKQREKSRKKKG